MRMPVPGAKKKNCQYSCSTTLLAPAVVRAFRAAPNRTQRAPVLIGNTNLHQTVAVNFKLGTAQTITAGTSIASAEANEIRAVDGAMRPLGHPVAGELRKNRPPVFD